MYQLRYTNGQVEDAEAKLADAIEAARELYSNAKVFLTIDGIYQDDTRILSMKGLSDLFEEQDALTDDERDERAYLDNYNFTHDTTL